MYNEDLINFRKLGTSDFMLMHKWLNRDFVIKWYGKRNHSLSEIEEKYSRYVNGEKPTHGYLMLYGDAPIGYIQTYKISDHPDYAVHVCMDENLSGIDLFIGEEDYIHKGLGKHIITKFLKDIVFLSDSEACIIGPEPNNKVAIKAYEKAGFKYVKIIQVDDEQEYIMKINRDEV